jgi:hypothetical protein
MRLLWSLICVLAILPTTARAQRAALPAMVERVPVDPPVVITTLASGATVQARHRAPVRRLRPGDHLVAVVRLAPANSPDQVDVRAVRTGPRSVVIHIGVRRFAGGLAANVVTTPYVEVDLGPAVAGSHEVRVRETIRPFDDLAHPDRTGPPTSGLGSRVTFQVAR